MRILHTADWQLGSKLLQAGERARQARAQRLETVEAIVQLVRSEDPDVVLVAGDTFEDHDVDDRSVRQAVRHLDALAPTPVIVLPGNHDPLVPGGVWDRSSWEAVGDHVTLARRAEPIEPMDGLVVYPCPITQKRSTQDPTRWIPDRDPGDERVRVGLAHGALDVLPDNVNFPIPADRAEQSGLDYLALGDWHGKLVQGRTAYSGTHEPTSYTEQDPGHVLLVDVGSEVDAPTIEARRVARFTWHEETSTVRGPTDVDRLKNSLREAGELSDALLRVRVELAADADEAAVEAVEALEEEIETEAFHLDWATDATTYLSQRPTELPEGVLSWVDEDLATILEGRIPEGPGQEAASRDPEVVREARALLHQLARRELG